jgi:hypothetical protein
MAVNKVELYVSQILEDLDNGLTWLKRDDLGYGSIQDKYNAKDQQIVMIRKHPKLKDAETNVTVFTVIDDTNEGTTTVSATESENANDMGNVSANDIDTRLPESASGDSNETQEQVYTSYHSRVPDEPVAVESESADAFFNI